MFVSSRFLAQCIRSNKVLNAQKKGFSTAHFSYPNNCKIFNDESKNAQLYKLKNTQSTRFENAPIHVRLCSTASSQSGWKINMLYDSECPLCMHEINFLRKRDVNKLVKFTDIAQLDYDPKGNGDVSYEVGMKKIHAVMETGEVISGMAVFREVYKAVGLGWVWSFTQLPGFSPLFDRFYDFWAAWRMKITGRPELDEIFQQRKEILKKYAAKKDALCEEDCKI